jgi:NADP-dependent 3-hydroxy acid dehydrogenase YdfG
MPDDHIGAGSIDGRALLLIGAGPGLGEAVARRFAEDGYRVTLVARSTDGLDKLAATLADTGTDIETISADASDPEGLRARMTALYHGDGAPGLIVYNAVMGAPDQLLTSSVAHLQEAYAVGVIGAIVVAQVAAPAMRAAGVGTIIVTGGGFADLPVPALATVSLGKAALRSAATILGADLQPDGSASRPSRSPGRSLQARLLTRSASPSATGRSSIQTVPGRRSFAFPARRRLGRMHSRRPDRRCWPLLARQFLGPDACNCLAGPTARGGRAICSQPMPSGPDGLDKQAPRPPPPLTTAGGKASFISGS